MFSSLPMPIFSSAGIFLVSKDLKCPNDDSTGAVCGENNQSYESECEMLTKGVQIAYKGVCKKNCQSEV